MECGEIDIIQVIIYGARAAYAKIDMTIVLEKNIKITFLDEQKPVYVVFGIGAEKYQTTIVNSPDPNWNQTEKFKIVSEEIPLRMAIYEQNEGSDEDVLLAKFKVPVQTMPDEEDSKELIARFSASDEMEKVSATSKSKGYILYECLVTRYRNPSASPIEFFKRHYSHFNDYLENQFLPSVGTDCLFGPCIKLYKSDILTARFRPPVHREPVVLGKLMESSLLFGAYLHHSFPTVQNVAIQKLQASKMHRPILKRNSRSSVNVRVSREDDKEEGEISAGLNVTPPIPKRMFKFLSKLKHHDNDEHAQRVTLALSRSRSLSQPDVTFSLKGGIVEEEMKESDPDQLNYITRRRKDTRISSVFPVVTEITPSSGSVWGGTRLTINGHNLGLDANDIIGLSVCGSNCVSTLQYESSGQIYCTTKSWRSCQGSVMVITASGGRSLCNASYSYVNDKNTLSPISDLAETVSLHDQPELQDYTESDRDFHRANYLLLHTTEEACQTDFGRSSAMDDRLSNYYTQTLEGENATLREVITDLEEEIKRLDNRNIRMQRYVDKVIARVLKEVPDALCARKGHISSESDYSTP